MPPFCATIRLAFSYSIYGRVLRVARWGHTGGTPLKLLEAAIQRKGCRVEERLDGQKKLIRKQIYDILVVSHQSSVVSQEVFCDNSRCLGVHQV